jgi:hypothetical protein
MPTALIVTVGGSHQPVLTSIKQQRPDRVYFLCSADQGKKSGSHVLVNGPGNVIKSDPTRDKPDLPCIAVQAGLDQNRYHVEKEPNFDDLDACYRSAVKLLALARKELPGARLVADYTAGTKSMSAGLVAAVLDDGQCELTVVVGSRIDLVKVVNRTEFVRRVSTSDTQVHRRMAEAHKLAMRYDYAAAGELLRAAAADLAGSSNLDRLQRGIALCRAFDEWDRFEHAAAQDCLEVYQREFVSHWRFLKSLCGADRGHGFEWVEDLLRNAERRAAQGRYDDAVGRVYRASELTAQVWLKEQRGVDTGDVDVQRVPEATRAGLERQREEGKTNTPGKIKIGLIQAWDLIAAWPDDPAGALYAPFRKKLLSFLTVRNQSLFAHGFRPISQEDHVRHVPDVQAWLYETMQDALEALGRKRPAPLEQFPTHFLESP